MFLSRKDLRKIILKEIKFKEIIKQDYIDVLFDYIIPKLSDEQIEVIADRLIGNESTMLKQALINNLKELRSEQQ